MAKRQMEDEDGLKRQARRRLIGAVALVTAVVVILPMVLDSEPRMAGQNIELRIPDPNKVGAFKSQIVLPAEPEPAATSAPTAASAVASPPVAAASKPQPVPAKPEPAKPKSGPVKPKPAQPEKTAPTAKSASKPVEKRHAAVKQGFAVQIGAYSNAATVKRLKAKLLLQGWSVYTEKVGGSVRVRIGPYATRKAAEKDLSKLKAQGMKPVLVAL